MLAVFKCANQLVHFKLYLKMEPITYVLFILYINIFIIVNCFIKRTEKFRIIDKFVNICICYEYIKFLYVSFDGYVHYVIKKIADKSNKI